MVSQTMVVNTDIHKAVTPRTLGEEINLAKSRRKALT